MTQLIQSEGTVLHVGTTAPIANASGDFDEAAYRTAVGTYTASSKSFADADRVRFLSDLPTFDPTRPESRTPTLDEGEIVGSGSTTRATASFTVLARKTDTDGYDAVKAAFKATTTLTCLVVFPDNSAKFFQGHVTGAQESAPIGGNKQMAITLAVQGEVIDVADITVTS